MATGGDPGPSKAATSAALDLAEIGVSGERLAAIAQRQPAISPLPGLFDPTPHVQFLIGPTKVGKTTFALALARAYALGVPPWIGAPPLPRKRAAAISREQPLERVLGTIRRLDDSRAQGEPSIDDNFDRLVLVARDVDLPKPGHALLTLDTGGLRVLREVVHHARDVGDPFGLVVLDSFSRLKPAEVRENESGEVSCWLDALDAIALEEGVYIVLIHHTGHARGTRSTDPRSAPRGSSAIAAVAQVLWLFDRDRDPHQRVLRVDGNAVFGDTLRFRVAPEGAAATEIHYFELEGGEPLVLPDVYIKPGEELSQSDIAWRICGLVPLPGKRPPGAAQARARALVEVWRAAGLVESRPGKHGGWVYSLPPCGVRS
jgi:hypothetical protein